VSLVSATSTQGIDFDWLDERTMDPVGYKRINKTTGKVITSEHIVKGVEYQKGRYVILDEDEIKAAHPKATQTIDIFAFVDRHEIPFLNIRKPYFLSPGPRGEKVYALLREALARTTKVALAYLVIHTRQHLAAVIPLDSALVVMLLRWPAEVRSIESLELHDSVSNAKLSAKELEMAERLVEEMTSGWEEEKYRNTFDENIMELVEEKATAGKLEAVPDTEGDLDDRRTAEVIDLTELLKRSLGGKAAPSPAKTARGRGAAARPSRAKAPPAAKKSPSSKTSSKKAPPKKTARK
jgi:DNA end-binding protein Ku